MRAVVLALTLAAAATSARAADGTLATGGSHEVVYEPPTALPVRGPRFAPVTIDVYIQLGHAPSYTAADLARRAVERSGDVRALVHLAELTRNTELPAEALVEAADQGHFFALFDRMIAARLLFTTPAELSRAAAEAGLDLARLDEALATRRHKGDVERLLREARQSTHRAVEILINGRRISPYANDDTVNRMIAEGRQRADELLAEGVPRAQLYDRLLDADQDVPFVLDPTARGANRRLQLSLATAPARGPAAAQVTAVVWANFACMQCADVAASLKKLQAAHPGMVRVVWKHFPSPYRQAIGQTAAEYAAAAQLQGRFWALHDVAMASHLIPARVTRGELDRMALQAGLDGTRLRLDVDGGRARALVERDAEEARRLGVPTAGSVAVNGLPIAGAPSYELLERMVAAELDAGVFERLRAPSGPSPAPRGASSFRDAR